MIPVIISGGSGTRLWPVSRNNSPKQFCQLFHDSLFNMTLKRLMVLDTPWIVTNNKLKDLTLTSIREFNLDKKKLILEPIGKNTAPAIALTCLRFLREGLGSQVIGIFPADHIISNEKSFFDALSAAEKEAQLEKIVTIGIKALESATGYGYIQVETNKGDSTATLNTPFSVKKFHEKPSLEKALAFVKSGQYFWNAGMFIFKVDTMVQLFMKYQTEMWSLIEQIDVDLNNLSSIYDKVSSISIDYAIVEKLASSELSCIPCDIGWNDVGSWDALSSLAPDEQTTKLEFEATNNYVHRFGNKTYSFIGVEDLIIVDTADATLITRKGHSQDVRHVVDQLKKSDSPLLDNQTYEVRPWGKFEVLKDTKNFKSKIINVKPHQQISYQSHNYREEHWIITCGEAEVILNNETIRVKKGDYIKIPQQSKHRIRNISSTVDVEFVEVQLGSSFSENDIIRYDDDYNRK